MIPEHSRIRRLQIRLRQYRLDPLRPQITLYPDRGSLAKNGKRLADGSQVLPQLNTYIRINTEMP
jgi:hypothetical protein